jgi:hypothetical protein
VQQRRQQQQTPATTPATSNSNSNNTSGSNNLPAPTRRPAAAIALEHDLFWLKVRLNGQDEQNLQNGRHGSIQQQWQ